jgi:hypothetical protein
LRREDQAVANSHVPKNSPDKSSHWHTMTRHFFLLLALSYLSLATAQVPVMQWKASATDKRTNPRIGVELSIESNFTLVVLIAF